MDRVLITGVDGMLGSNLALALANQHVVGLHHPACPITLRGCATVACDVADRDEFASCCNDLRPEFVVHCSLLSLSSWDLPKAEPLDEHAEINAVENLAALSATARFRLAVILTDDVFRGPRIFHDEDSPALASTASARLARDIESRLLQRGALVVRTHAYGWSPLSTSAGTCEMIYRAIDSALPLAIDHQCHATPILATDLAPLLLNAYRNELRGLYHIAGAERTSPLRFAQELATLINRSFQRIAPPSSTLARVPAEQRGETSLNTRRARRALKLAMPLLHEGVRRWISQIDNGHRAYLHVTESLASAGRAA